MTSKSPVDDSLIWEFKDKKFIKTIVSKGYGFSSPQDGSVCKLKVLKDDSHILTDLNEDQVKEIIVGDVDEPIEKVLEACLRTMKNEEICDLNFPDPSHIVPVSNNNNNNVTDTSTNVDSESQDVLSPTKNCCIAQSPVCEEEQNPEKTMDKGNEIEQSKTGSSPSIEEQILHCAKNNDSGLDTSCISNEVPSLNEITGSGQETVIEVLPTIFNLQLQLLSYTREPEIHEMSITEKWRRANYHKQKGMELYARGLYEWAFHRFGLSLKYIISLEHDLPSGQEEGMNIVGVKLSCYLNVAACQMRHHNYESVVKNCSKALELQPSNAKALYRRGSAYLQLQEYEKSKEDLTRAQEYEPKNQAIVKQQQLLKAKVQKLNQYYANAMKKMFT